MSRIYTCAFIAMALAACQEVTSDNFINPPPGAPATCAVIGDLPGCDQGSISYACTSDRPDDVGSDAGKGDTAQLVCSDGAMGPDGAALFCCIPISQYYTDCAPDEAIPGCDASAVGFACTGQGSLGSQGSGQVTSPSGADPTIACSAGQLGADGITERYCCNTSAIPAACVIEPTATCDGIAVAYTCSGDATPGDGDPTMACAAGATGADGTSYCCIPFAASADTCSPATPDVVSCPAGELAFTCSGADTPDGLDPAIACVPTLRGYCCTVSSTE